MVELEIVIVGAGLSGLAASCQCALSGHRVTVLESARELAEVLPSSSSFRIEIWKLNATKRNETELTNT